MTRTQTENKFYPTVIFTSAVGSGYRLVYPDTLLLNAPVQRDYILELAKAANHVLVGEQADSTYSFRQWTEAVGTQSERLGTITIPRRTNDLVYLAEKAGVFIQYSLQLDSAPQHILMILGML